MAGLTDAVRASVLNHLLRTSTWSKPSAIYIGLFTVMPTANAGTGGTEVSGGSYARQQVVQSDANWKDPASAVIGLATNVNAVTFPAATADWGTINAVGFFDAVSAGNLLAFYPIEASGGSIYEATGIASTDILTAPGSAFTNGQTVKVLAPDAAINAASIPTGLVAGTQYFVVSASGNTFKLSLTSGGAAVDITVDGSCFVLAEGSITIRNGSQFKFNAAALGLGLGG